MNKVILIGNLTRDPELSNTASGVAMCRLGIAVNRNYTNSEGNRETDFFNITTWRGLAERCGKYLRKGSKIALVGNLQMRSFEVNGEKRSMIDIIAEDVEFLSPKGSTDGDTLTANTESQEKVVKLEPVDDSDLPF
ncbi:MAG: single-stranded DNA-binding protein [Clostridia bacterium]|nr:single-stranded DNA-binding protein [Clostridia bacterium]